MQTARYDPSVFDVTSIAHARNIILTPEGGLSTDERWQRETPYLLELIGGLDLGPSSVLLDYGCGLGRMTKLVIERYGCTVVGADISANMRALSASYVNSDRFFSCHPIMLDRLGIKFEAALAIWVIQHCLQPAQDVDRIGDVLVDRGRLFVVNNDQRAVPSDRGWVEDGQNVEALLDARFDPVSKGRMDSEIVSEMVSERTFWAIYRMRGYDASR